MIKLLCKITTKKGMTALLSDIIAFIFTYLIYILPALALVSFIVLLVIYKKKKSESSQTENELARLKNLKLAVKVTGILTAVFVAVLITLGILFLLFMAHM